MRAGATCGLSPALAPSPIAASGVPAIASATAGALAVLTASVDKTARLWDAESGKMLETFDGHGGPVYSATLSPDGNRALTASWDNTARMWDTRSGRQLANLNGHVDWVISAQFSPDGDRVLTVSFDQTARVWDAEKGTLVSTLTGHQGRINRGACVIARWPLSRYPRI
jgi:WD40 repeat protein